jgi:hypothetical protein
MQGEALEDRWKRQKLTNKPMLRHIPLSGMQWPVRWATLEDEGAGFAIADTQQLRHAPRVVRHNTGPTMSEGGGEARIARLEQMVHQLKAELGNRRTLLEERVSSLESRKRKESCKPLSEMRGARLAW